RTSRLRRALGGRRRSVDRIGAREGIEPLRHDPVDAVRREARPDRLLLRVDGNLEERPRWISPAYVVDGDWPRDQIAVGAGVVEAHEVVVAAVLPDRRVDAEALV